MVYEEFGRTDTKEKEKCGGVVEEREEMIYVKHESTKGLVYLFTWTLVPLLTATQLVPEMVPVFSLPSKYRSNVWLETR